MSQSKKKRPIPLAGIEGCGFSEDGDSVTFTLEAQNKQSFTFSVPHEAVGEIVVALLTAADRAAERRPKTVLGAGDPHRVERSFPLERFLVSGSLEDGKVALTLYARSTEHSLIIERADAQALGEALQTAVRRIAN